MNTPQKDAWRYYRAQYRGRYGRIGAVVAASAAVSFFSLPVIFLVQRVFDRYLPARDVRGVALAAAVMLGASLASAAVLLWIRVTTLDVTKAAILEIRSRLEECLYRLPRATFTGGDRLKLHNTIVQDTERIDVMSNAVVAQAMPALLSAAVLMLILLRMNWLLTLVMLAVAPAAIACNRWLGGKLNQDVRRFRAAFERFSSGVLFLLDAIDLTRLLNAEESELARQRNTAEELRVTSLRVAWFDTLFQLSQNSVTMVAGLAILVTGAVAVAAHRMSIGELLAFYVTVRLLNSQTNIVISSVPQMVTGAQALCDTYELLTHDGAQAYGGTKAIDFQGRIALEDVSFAYVPGRWVLRHADLEIAPGETVALVGPNGCGKSSIVWLLCGFYRPEEGRLLADGIGYEDLDLRQLRRQLGVVPQDPLLFPATVHDNIAYGRPQASDAEIREAAEWSTAHAAIAAMEQGYETAVGTGGQMISGGQRQRIAIARALLGRPRFLILDEPTNHMDAAAIGALMANLRRLPQRPAILLVSHDPRIVEHCDRVIRMQPEGICLSELPVAEETEP
jgi:ABC-type bacteriocin/lantibiotic exporter with double-glycine peptidase domain